MRRRRHGAPEEVTLNLAAMLDMAFQLLTFFILTFKPAPVEGQILLRLPPPQATTAKGTKAAGEAKTDDIAKGLETLMITISSQGGGAIGQMSVGDKIFSTVPQVKEELRRSFENPATPYEQVIVQVDANLRYDELMKVIGACAELEIPDPADPNKRKKLTKLSFVKMNDEAPK